MIDELVVRNLGVIRHAQIEFGAGLTVVTGETGAGKTLLLGALRLLLGADARPDLIGPFDDEASVEGRLVRDGVEVGAARRLRRAGRSRTYLDGSIASAAALDAATAGAVEIIGQHDQLAITRPGEVRRLVDRLLDDEGRAAWSGYADAWARWRGLLEDREALGGDRPRLERERAAAANDVETIDAAALSPGEEEELASLLGRLRNAEQIRELAAGALEAAQRARDDLGTAVGALRRVRALDPGVSDATDSAEGLESESGALAAELAQLLGSLDHEPHELEVAEQRQSVLAELQRRFGATLAEVLRFGESQRRRHAELVDLLDRSDRLDSELAAAEQSLTDAGRALREARRDAGGRLAEAARVHLVALGFARPLVEVRVDDAEPAAGGADTSAIHFASDDRLEPGPVARVASGGELSRLVLALRLASDVDDVETLVFDEIDSGVGGATAVAMGEKLAALASSRQVLCVTHLPQVAAYADTHWVVDRDGEEAVVRHVTSSDRVEELSRMLAGMPMSERGRDAAEELLVRAGRGNTVTP